MTELGWALREAPNGGDRGRWRYRSSQWRKVPGTNRRVPVRHDSPDAIVSERPELRIIDQELWEATQERLKSVHRF